MFVKLPACLRILDLEISFFPLIRLLIELVCLTLHDFAVLQLARLVFFSFLSESKQRKGKAKIPFFDLFLHKDK